MTTSFEKTFRIISKDVIIEIIKFLDYRDVIRFCASQKSKLYYICQSNEDIIWKFLLERDFFVDPTTVPKGKAKSSYIKLAQGHQVWTFGEGRDGQLGHGNKENIFTPKAIKGFDNIVQVSCGASHTAMIDSDGQIWTYGYEGFGELGHGENRNYDDNFIPTPIEGFNNIVQVSCGGSHTVMIDNVSGKNGGQVWTFGLGDEGQLGHNSTDDEYIPKAIKGFNNIIQVSCRGSHTAMIDSKNQVWTFGWGKKGQLGHNDTSNELIPKAIEGFNNIIQVSCGGRHTAMIDATGQIWTWGNGRDGRLGHGNTDKVLIPKAIKGFNNIVQVSCGRWYTAMIDSTGQVWTFGWGKAGQLGHGNFRIVLIPTAIEGFDNIIQVSCGTYHTAMIDVEGQVWTFGSEKDGFLGHGNTDDVLIPKAIKGFDNIIQVSCGESQTAITFE